MEQVGVTGDAEAARPGSRAGARATLVVVNPASASGRTAHRWQQIEQRLIEQGLETQTRLTAGVGDAADLTRAFLQEGGREIVVLGGDGTINEVVSGCIAEDGRQVLADEITLGVIHQGTGGDLARGLGLPTRLDAAIAVACTGEPKPVDVGVATFRTDGDGAATRAFVGVSNVGMGAEVVERVTGRLKRLGNNGAFAAATVACLLRNRARPVTVTVDGTRHDLSIVDLIVANNRFMGGGMLVAPDAQIDDGRFDVVLISAANAARLVATFPRIYRGTHVQHPLVRVERAREVVVEAPGDGEGVVLDGELVGRTPVEYRMLPAPLRIRVPSRRVAGQDTA